MLSSTDIDTCIGIGRIRIRGYGNFLKNPIRGYVYYLKNKIIIIMQRHKVFPPPIIIMASPEWSQFMLVSRYLIGNTSKIS